MLFDSSNSHQQLMRFILSCNWEAFPESFIHMAMHMPSLCMVSVVGKTSIIQGWILNQVGIMPAVCTLLTKRAGPSQDLLGRFRRRLGWLAQSEWRKTTCEFPVLIRQAIKPQSSLETLLSDTKWPRSMASLAMASPEGCHLIKDSLPRQPNLNHQTRWPIDSVMSLEVSSYYISYSYLLNNILTVNRMQYWSLLYMYVYVIWIITYCHSFE